MKILLTDCATLKNNNDISTDIFKSFGEVKEYDNISRQELLKEVSDTHIILCNKTVIDSEIISRAGNLKYIGVFATGFNNIDIPSAIKRGIPVCNAGSYSTNAVVQQVMGYILMHYTRIPENNDFVKKGGWINHPVFSALEFTGDEVYGKTLGIVGFGSIGKAVKKAAEGMGMKVIVNTRTVRDDGDTEFVDFDTLLSRSDIITLHCPLNNESKDLMNKSAFSKMKDGAFFINTSRGGTVDELALAEALNTDKLSGAAVDVLKSEPMAADCPLLKAKNIIITPHTAWAALTTRQRLIDIAADNLNSFLKGDIKNNVAK